MTLRVIYIYIYIYIYSIHTHISLSLYLCVLYALYTVCQYRQLQVHAHPLLGRLCHLRQHRGRAEDRSGAPQGGLREGEGEAARVHFQRGQEVRQSRSPGSGNMGFIVFIVEEVWVLLHFPFLIYGFY